VYRYPERSDHATCHRVRNTKASTPSQSSHSPWAPFQIPREERFGRDHNSQLDAAPNSASRLVWSVRHANASGHSGIAPSIAGVCTGLEPLGFWVGGAGGTMGGLLLCPPCPSIQPHPRKVVERLARVQQELRLRLWVRGFPLAALKSRVSRAYQRGG